MFENPSQFSLHIEELAVTKNLTHLEALLLFCEETDAEYDEVAEMLSGTLKERIYIEAAKNYSMPKRTAVILED